MSVGPCTSWRVFAEEYHAQGHCNNEDERDYEGYAPGFVWGQATVMDQGVEDCGHDEARRSD